MRRSCLVLPAEPISTSYQSPICTQSDMDASNFGVNTAGKMVLSDFGAVGLLPASFASCAIILSTKSFAVAVAKCSGLSRSPSLESMLGLDEVGSARG